MATLSMHVKGKPPLEMLKSRTDLTEEIVLLVQRLLEKDPRKRPGAAATSKLLSEETMTMVLEHNGSQLAENSDDEPMKLHLETAASFRASKRKSLTPPVFILAATVAVSLLTWHCIRCFSSIGEAPKTNLKAIGGETLSAVSKDSLLRSLIDKNENGFIHVQDLSVVTDDQLKVFETIPPQKVLELELSDNVELTDKGLSYLHNLRDLKVLRIAGTQAHHLD